MAPFYASSIDGVRWLNLEHYLMIKRRHWDGSSVTVAKLLKGKFLCRRGVLIPQLSLYNPTKPITRSRDDRVIIIPQELKVGVLIDVARN